MNANKTMTPTKVKRESKRRIRVEFERTPLLERLKAKFINGAFLVNIIWFLFRFLLLLGVSYVILYPFYTKIAGSFMSAQDFVDVTVRLIPRHPTLGTYAAIIEDNDYLLAFRNTFLLSTLCAVLQTFICCVIAYGFAKFKFKGSKLLFLLVIFTMVVPHSTLQLSMFMKFRYFDIGIGKYGILSLLGGGIFESFAILEEPSWNLLNSYWPLVLLSATGLAFKNGLYIFMLRQFFTGVPDALEESAYIDGSGVFRTFFTIILPLSIPMMVTVFLFAFCWQWTDDFYTELFFTTQKIVLMPDVVDIPKSLQTDYAGQNMYYTAIRNTCGICIIMPLVILYCFGQNFLVQGIERSGLTAE